jgi:hypothetical protein
MYLDLDDVLDRLDVGQQPERQNEQGEHVRACLESRLLS